MNQQDIPHSGNIARRVFPNGMIVLVREHFHAKSVVMTGSLEAGSLNEPSPGLVNFLGSMLMRGTQHYAFTALHEALESVGANLSVSAGRHGISFGGKSLGEDLPLLLELLAEVLRRPAFPADQLERLRGELLTMLKMREQDTRFRAGRAFNELAYPPEHPYHHDTIGTEQDIQSFTPADLFAYHQQQFGTRGMILSVVGNVQADEVFQLVETAFGDWQNPHQRDLPPLPDLARMPAFQECAVSLAGKSQTDIILGVPGPRRTAEDYQAARLANNILGVFGMYGRLGKTVREEQGLAYYCYSQLAGGHGPGGWRVAAGVAPTNVKLAVASMRREIERMLTTLVSAQELADNQSNLIGSLPIQLESNEGVAGILYNMERFQLGLDYLVNYPATIASITAEEVQSAFQNYWHAEAFALATAGPELAEAVL